MRPIRRAFGVDRLQIPRRDSGFAARALNRDCYDFLANLEQRLSVRYENDSHVTTKFFQRAYEQSLRIGIKGTCWFIEQDQFRMGSQCPSQGDPLDLTTRHGIGSRPDHGLITARARNDLVVYVCKFSCVNDEIVSYGAEEPDVVGYRAGDKFGVLWDVSDKP